MKKQWVSSYLTGLATVALALMWAYAAFSKLVAYEEFRFGLLNHRLLKDHAALVACAIPAVELAIVAALFTGRFNRLGFILSAVLLVVFTVYILYMFTAYPHTPCSCGGIISRLSWQQHIVFNVVFLVISLCGLASPDMPKKIFMLHEPVFGGHRQQAGKAET